MAEKDRALREAQALMPAGETVKLAVICQIKGSGGAGAAATRTAKDVAVSMAVSAAISATGFGVLRATTPAPMWVVITDQRFMVFRKKVLGIKSDDLIFEAPLSAVQVEGNGGLMKSVTVIEAATSAPVCSLNLGMRTSAWKSIIETARVA